MDCMVKMVKFPSKTQQVLNSHLIIVVGKTVTVKNLNKPAIVKFSLKERLTEVS